MFEVVMIKHVILWKLKEDVKDPKKVKADAKAALEALSETISEIVEIKVITQGLESSTCDMMLDSTFKTADDLNSYKIHPHHVHAADTYVRPFVDTGLCLDFEE